MVSKGVLNTHLGDHGAQELSLQFVSLKQFFMNLFRKKDQSFSLLDMRRDRSIKRWIKNRLNHITIRKMLKCLNQEKVSLIILDCVFPELIDASKKVKRRLNYVSLMRSAPHCFSWTTDASSMSRFTGQLLAVDRVICASKDIVGMWENKINAPLNHIYLPNPLPLKPQGSELSSFCDENSFNIVVVSGALGPRKGLNLIFDSISASEILKNRKIIVHFFGSMVHWEPNEKFYSHLNQLEVRYHGFQKIKYSQSKATNICMVFTSFSEVASRAPVEAASVTCPVLINRYGADVSYWDIYSQDCFFSNAESLSKKLTKILQVDDTDRFRPNKTWTSIMELNKRSYVAGIEEIVRFDETIC